MSGGKFYCLGAFAVLSACASPPSAVGNADLVIRDVRLIDVGRETTSAPTTVVVNHGSVVFVGDRPPKTLTAKREIVASGSYLLPGLWDMHVHALWADGLWTVASQAFMASCVTGIRDMGGKLTELERARADDSVSPELVAAGMILDGPQPVDPDISIAIGTAEEASAAVSRLHDNGADFVKLYTLLPPSVFSTVVRRAGDAGLDIVGHIPFGLDPVAAARSMRSIEHMQAETGLYCDPDQPQSCLSLMSEFKAQPSWQTPTLAARGVRAHFEPISGQQVAASTSKFPEAAKKLWDSQFAQWIEEGAENVARKRRDFERERKLAQMLIAHDVPILAGSDAGIPLVPFGQGLHQELRLFVNGGATPAQALRSAIVQPARYLRRPERSTVAVGAPADFCLLDSDPLTNIAAAGRPWLTLVKGRVGFERLRPPVAAAHSAKVH